MKYLDRCDALEIFSVGLIVIGLLLIIAGLLLLIYAVGHYPSSGCVPHVAI